MKQSVICYSIVMYPIVTQIVNNKDFRNTIIVYFQMNIFVILKYLFEI